MASCYAYVDGSDLELLELELLPAFHAVIGTWQVSSARIVNDRYPVTPDLRPEDLPDWFLGLNFEAAEMSRQKLEALVAFLQQLSITTGREFVIGGPLPGTQVSKDFCMVGSPGERPYEDVFQWFAL